MKTLATIDLDRGRGRGDLFWRDGQIWCLESHGEEYSTDVPCEQADAKSAIVSSWGVGWGLRLIEEL